MIEVHGKEMRILAFSFIMLMPALLLVLIVSGSHSMQVAGILGSARIQNPWASAVYAVDALIYGAWLAALEFPVLTPALVWIGTYLGIYGYWATVAL